MRDRIQKHDTQKPVQTPAGNLMPAPLSAKRILEQMTPEQFVFLNLKVPTYVDALLQEAGWEQSCPTCGRTLDQGG